MKTIATLLLACFASLVCFVSMAVSQEAQVILRSTVKGNQEQPNVLYIVPWQKGETPELIYQPMQTLVNGVFEPVDREEFLRELDYREKINVTITDSQP